MGSERNYDDLLFPLLYGEGNYVGFFDKIFEFLYQRTDFYKVKQNEADDFELASGEAEKIVRHVFCKYMEQSFAEQRKLMTPESDTVPLDFISEEVVTADNSVIIENTSTSIEEEEDDTKSDLNENLTPNTIDKNNDDKSDVKIPLMDPDCYNGAKYELYSWSQTLKDVDVRIKVPSDISTGKKVRVDIQQSLLKTELYENGQWTTLKEGGLSWKINVEESTWTFVPHEYIHICLQKMQERWWDSFFLGEPKINLKAIDASIPYEDLDSESRAKIAELMYNEHRKRLGKPTIQQTKYQHILKDAWDKEGSPFKGQPFDPTIVNIQQSDAL